MIWNRISFTLLLSIGASLMAPAQTDADAEAERRRLAFEEAMRKVENAEKARAEATRSGDEAAAVAREAQEKLRAAAAAQAAAAPTTVAAGDATLDAVDTFANEVEKKAPAPKPAATSKPATPKPTAEPKVTPKPIEPVLPKGAPQGGAPVEGNGPAPGGVIGAANAVKAKKAPEETIIDAEELIFDGSGQHGDAFKVVMFERNVELQHPQFNMSSDKLTAFFKQQAAPEPDPNAPAAVAAPEEGGGGDKLERAIATGREVVVTKAMEDGEPQIAKARKATYFADRGEVMLEIWPQVQRGRNLVIAKSKDTVIILKGEEMIVKGPVRTKIVGKGPMGGAAEPATTDKKPKKEGDGLTVIDAELGAVFNRPSSLAGHKEIFFDGGVSVADPEFDMVDGDTLTAYTKTDEKTGESIMSSAVMRGQKVRVQERTGKQRQGTARAVAFYPNSGDIKLEGYPAIYDGIQWKNIDSPTGVMFLNEKTGDVKGSGGRSKMSFQPGLKPPA